MDTDKSASVREDIDEKMVISGFSSHDMIQSQLSPNNDILELLSSSLSRPVRLPFMFSIISQSCESIWKSPEAV